MHARLFRWNLVSGIRSSIASKGGVRQCQVCAMPVGGTKWYWIQDTPVQDF